MTPTDFISKVLELHPFAAVAPRGAESVIYLGKPFGTIRVMGDGRLACNGIMPLSLADLLIDF
jgi:hypothetical protein